MRIRQTDRMFNHGHLFQNLNFKMVQQKLCTGPKEDPQEAFRLAVAYEGVIRQHQTFESGRKDIKSEIAYVVSERKNP